MQTKKSAENPFINLAFSVALPSLILTKLSTPERLGPVNGLLVALAFPIGYSLYDYYRRREFSFITALGFISTLLTGVFALYELPAHWIAVKEASVPSLIGLAILFSTRSENPLVKRVLYNDTVINVDLVEERLNTDQKKVGFNKLMIEASYLLACAFAFSAFLNYGLAKFLLLSSPGTPEFNAQLGKMNALSWPVIALPSTAVMMFALFRLMKGIQKLTGLEMEEVLKSQSKSTASK